MFQFIAYIRPIGKSLFIYVKVIIMNCPLGDPIIYLGISDEWRLRIRQVYPKLRVGPLEYRLRKVFQIDFSNHPKFAWTNPNMRQRTANRQMFVT